MNRVTRIIKLRRLGVSKLSLLVLAVILLLLITTAWVIRSQLTVSNPIPLSVRKAVNFPLYYPTSLPIDYSVDKTSFNIENKNVVTYSYTDNRGDELYVSQETKPTNSIVYDGFARSNIQHYKVINTKIGAASFGILTSDPSITIISLVTSKSWIIFDTTGYLSNSSVSSLINSLRLS